MLVHIVRDGGATKVPREVVDEAEVEALRAAGHEVEVPAREPEAAESLVVPSVTRPPRPKRNQSA